MIGNSQPARSRAAGGRPQRLPIPGGELGWISDDLFLQQQLPRSIVIVGAGYIACEFACILQGLGVAVTQVIRGDHILKGFDRELSDAVREGMEELGITLRFGLQPSAIEQTNSGMVLRCGDTALEADVVPQAAGRGWNPGTGEGGIARRA